MFSKKISIICFAVAAAVVFAAGCGRKETVESGGAPSEVTESETAAIRMEEAETEEYAADEETVESEEVMSQAGPGTEALDSRESRGPGKKIEAFAEKVQEAVADRDMEAFADLLFYPCVLVTGDQETITLKQREDLMKQNPDVVFGDDLMVAVANVDTVTLEMTEEGVVLGEGASNITFQEKSDGSIGITEIRE